MTKLRLAPDLTLPLEAITETIAILGIRGSGKTNTAAAYAEELLAAGQQVVIIDPTDAWWGLKSSADGLKPGFPVVVLGGKHQDLPLSSGDGKLVADFVVEQGVSVICCLRGFESKQQELTFATAFLRRLYYLKGQQETPTPLALIIDEASRLVPQRVMGEDAQCVGAVQQIVRQGRSSGFGVALIDQRAATVNKDVLAMLEMLVVHRTTSPGDRKTLREWIEQHDSESREKEFLSTLASLKQGEAWFWSPGWLDLFKRVQVRPRKTFDSSRTPRAGETIIAPKKIADVDLAALREKMTATIEKAKADDPKELRARIVQLERELRVRPTHNLGDISHATMVSQISAAVAAERAQQQRSGARFIERMNRYATSMGQNAQTFHDALVELKESMVAMASEPVAPNVKLHERKPLSTPPVSSPRAVRAAPAEGAIGNTAQRMLNALLFLETVGTSPAPRQAVAGLCSVSWDTGTFRNNVSALRTRGYVTDHADGALALTDDGRAQASDDGLPTSRRELHEAWLAKLGGTTAKMFRIILDAYPKAVERAVIAEQIGVSWDTGTFRNNLSEMRSPGLITDATKTAVRASDALFPDGLR